MPGENLAERVDLEIIRTLVGAIIQADQFGTSIAKTLRVYAEGLRTRRRQQVEELAAKTAVKLVFPLVFFHLPDSVHRGAGTIHPGDRGFVHEVFYVIDKKGERNG